MNYQSLIDIVIGGALAALGWFASELWSAVKELKSDLAKLREELPTKYLSKDDWRDDLRGLNARLDKLFDKLDGKVDK